MLQVARVPEMLRVREHIDLFRSYYPHPLPAAEVLRIAKLEGIADQLFGKLSGGQKQRVLFGLALCGESRSDFPGPSRRWAWILSRAAACGIRCGRFPRRVRRFC